MFSASLSPGPLSSSGRSERRQSGQVPRTSKRPRAHIRKHSTSSTDPNDRPRLARPACRENSLSKEVFETRFENPFKAIGRGVGQKQDRGGSAHNTSSSQPRAASPRKTVNLRVVLSSLRHSFSSARSDDVSPGPSISSQSTANSSTSSGSESQDCIRNGVQRTDPYGPPYFADAPAQESIRSARSRVSSLSSFGGISLSISVASAISAYGTTGGTPVSTSSDKLSAAAAIAEAARNGRLRDAVGLGSDSTLY
ncbi:hypothetical protein C8T65DRAFT_646294 [Cerioporus squamosus]|nr:hypothetical protein C8T65DRAFT_646294 [Cerioporus squamosus]